MTITGTDVPAADVAAAHSIPARADDKHVDKTFYLMLVPAVALFTFFITLPAFIGLYYSFTNYVGYGAYHFIGLTNYRAAFSDPNIRHAYGFTLVFAITTTIVTNVIALALAVGLASRIKFRTPLRTIFFIPMVLSGLVVSYVFNYMFSTSVPVIGTNLHIGFLQTSILTQDHYAWLGIVFVSAWQSCPGMIIIYLAGLLSIPTEVYEAAALDGARAWGVFTHVTLPLIFGYLIINSVLGLKGFLNTYEIPVALTGGGPGTSTQSVAMTIFTGYTGGDLAYQMANAFLFFIVTVVLSVAQLGFLRKKGMSL
jgi:raffinose/stachyose/melibiose transport system permease protein